MADLKNLKSIDLVSTTIIGTSINVVWSIIFTILLIIALFLVSVMFDTGFPIIGLVIIGLGIIFGTVVFGISEYFGVTFLYNFFAKRMKNVKINIKDMNRITEISVSSLALIVAVLSLVVSIIIYPLIFLVLSFIPLIIQLLQIISLQGLSWLVYPASFAFTPLFIIYAFVIGFVLTAVGAFIFNKISPMIDGLKVSLSSEGNLTKIDSIDPKSAGIISGVISLVFGLLYGLLFSFVSGNLPANLILIVGLGIGSLVGGFICGALNSILYNTLAKKFGPVKLELENSK